MKDPRSVVRKAIVTEKGTGLREKINQYHFEVATDANKIDIKGAIEKIFSVKVRTVRTQQVRGKVKSGAAPPGAPRRDWKKAIVTLKSDQKIELFEQI